MKPTLWKALISYIIDFTKFKLYEVLYKISNSIAISREVQHSNRVSLLAEDGDSEQRSVRLPLSLATTFALLEACCGAPHQRLAAPSGHRQ